MNKSQLHGEPGRSGKGLRGALTGLLGAALLCIPVPALACTLYAAQGTAVADGGTIAAAGTVTASIGTSPARRLSLLWSLWWAVRASSAAWRCQ